MENFGQSKVTAIRLRTLFINKYSIDIKQKSHKCFCHTGNDLSRLQTPPQKGRQSGKRGLFYFVFNK